MPIGMLRDAHHSQSLEASALAAASLLRSMSDSRRLILLCKLYELRSADIRGLSRETGMPPLVVGRLLASLCGEHLVEHDALLGPYRYRIADSRLRQLLLTLHGIFCPPRAPVPIPTSAQGAGLWL